MERGRGQPTTYPQPPCLPNENLLRTSPSALHNMNFLQSPPPRTPLFQSILPPPTSSLSHWPGRRQEILSRVMMMLDARCSTSSSSLQVVNSKWRRGRVGGVRTKRQGEGHGEGLNIQSSHGRHSWRIDWAKVMCKRLIRNAPPAIQACQGTYDKRKGWGEGGGLEGRR